MSKNLTLILQQKVESLRKDSPKESTQSSTQTAAMSKIKYVNVLSKEIVINIKLVNSLFTEQKSIQVQSERVKDQFEVEVFKAIQNLENKMIDIQKIVDEQFQNENNQLKAHIKVMITCLYQKLSKVSVQLQNYKLTRFNQQSRHKKLIDIRPKTKILKNVDQNRKEENKYQEELQSQNQELLSRFSNDQDKIQENQKKLIEISQLIAKFSLKVSEQDQMTDQITGFAKDSLHDVEEANKHLHKASEYSSGFGQIWSYYFISLAVFLLAYDFMRP